MTFPISSFIEAFQHAPRPTPEEITPHRCCECDRVQDDFAPYAVDDVPDQVIELRVSRIPSGRYVF